MTASDVLFVCSIFALLTLISASSTVWGEPEYQCTSRLRIIFPCKCVKGSDVGLYIKCENTNLATLSVALQNLAALEMPIEHLTIRKGHFLRLYGPIFAKTNARLLTIEDTPLEAIEDYAFYGVNKTLEELYILQSNLSMITPLSFGILGKLKLLIIDGHMMNAMAKNLFTGQQISNRIEVLRLINGPLNEVPLETLQPLHKLKNLDLHGNQLDALKRNQFKTLRDVEVLDVSFNRIKKLEAQHLAGLTKLGWFNASNNALTEIARGTFSLNSVLKVLHLSFNNITRLDINSFRGMRFLRRLYLNDNNISAVGRGTFGSVAKIGTIDLSRNALKKIEYQMFSQLNYVEILNLAENNITLIEKNSFKDIYQAMINISHNAIEKIESVAFENCVNITVLDLSFNRLSNFSKNAFDLTTFATEFQLSHNFITNLAHIPFQNMTAIKVLNASYNNITEIPKNCIPKLYELYNIDLSHNNISIIANGVFQTLFSLRFLNLSYNNLQEIKSSMFGTLPTLLEMNLSNNKLTSIVRGALAKLTSMRLLDLSNNELENIFQIPISLNELNLSANRISSIPAGTWPVMNALIYLDLSDNEIGDSLDANSFTGLLVLQRLLLNNNGVSQPPAECLAAMATLQYLYLQHNNITRLEKKAFGRLPVLFELNLHGNEIVNIDKRAFEGLLQLLTLNLSANALSTITNEAFMGLPSLRKLDLSHNFLSKLDNKTNGVLDDLLSLEDLNLSHNRISFVTKKTFPSHPYIPYNLKYLDLSYNQMPVLTYDITFGTKKLLKLVLSHNNINEMRRGVLANFTSLQYLDLSNNELSNLVSEEHVFDLPENLTTIYLQNNHIYRMPFENFNKIPKFELIDLRNNSLTEFPQMLVSNLRNGTTILYAGNPLHCNCVSRPLKHYTLEQTDLSDDLRNITCNTPSTVKGQPLEDVPDEVLECIAEERDTFNDLAYKEQTDIRFRDIQLNKNGNITVRWFVVSNRDIADFNVYVRNSQNKILFDALHTYNVRNSQIPIADIQRRETNLNDAEICITALNSNGSLNRWFSGQCNKLPALAYKKKSFFWSTNSSRSSFNHRYNNCLFSFLLILVIKITKYFLQ